MTESTKLTDSERKVFKTYFEKLIDGDVELDSGKHSALLEILGRKEEHGRPVKLTDSDKELIKRYYDKVIRFDEELSFKEYSNLVRILNEVDDKEREKQKKSNTPP